MLMISAVALISIATLCCLFLRIENFPPDVAVRLEAGKEIVSGATPYVDFFVLDAPFSLFLNTLPVRLAHALHFFDGYSLAGCSLIFNWLLSAASIALTASLFLRQKHLRDSLTCHAFLLTYALLNFTAIYQFGQNEHLLMLGFIPYAVARWLEFSGKTLSLLERLLCGIAGGATAMLDPFFPAIYALWEVSLMAQFMRLSVKPFGVLTVAVLTALGIFSWDSIVNHAMMDSYRENILPLLLADRSSFDMRLYGFFSVPDTRPSIYALLLATVLVFGLPKRSSLMPPLAVTGWLGFCYYVAECKAFSYQAIPMFWTAALILSIAATALFEDVSRAFRRRQQNAVYAESEVNAINEASAAKPANAETENAANAVITINTANAKGWTTAKAVTPTILLCAAIGISFCASLYLQNKQAIAARTAHERLRGFEYTDIPDVTDSISTFSQKSDRVLVLNNGTAPAYPALLFQDKQPGSRILWGFHLPILARWEQIPTQNQATRQRLEQFYDQILKEDLAERPPALIVVQDGVTQEQLQKLGTMKYIDDNYAFQSEANYFTNNEAPKEFANCNYVSKVLTRVF